MISSSNTARPAATLSRTGDELVTLGTTLKQRPLKVAFYLPGIRQMILDQDAVPIRHDLIDAAKIQEMITDLRATQKTLRRMQRELE